MHDFNLILGLANLLFAFVSGGLAIPFLLGRMKLTAPHRVRLTQTLESPENWQKINRVGARHLLVWSAIIAAIGIICFYVPPLNQKMIWFFGLSPCLIGFSFGQTYLYVRRLQASHADTD